MPPSFRDFVCFFQFAVRVLLLYLVVLVFTHLDFCVVLLKWMSFTMSAWSLTHKSHALKSLFYVAQLCKCIIFHRNPLKSIISSMALLFLWHLTAAAPPDSCSAALWCSGALPPSTKSHNLPSVEAFSYHVQPCCIQNRSGQNRGSCGAPLSESRSSILDPCLRF